MKRTPLTRKTPMKRASSLPQGGAPLARTRERKTHRPLRREPMPQDLREAVKARARGLCDCCGERLPDVWDAHHRQLRSRGGKDTLENLVALKHGHHMRLHDNPADATGRGLMVQSWEDPARVAILRHGRAWALPTGDTWTPAHQRDMEETDNG